MASQLNVSAPGFNEATCFVASNQAAMIYYAHQNKVYTFNVATGQYKEVLTLGAGEKVTCLKFNLYDEPFGWNAVDYGIFKNKGEEAQKIYYVLGVAKFDIEVNLPHPHFLSHLHKLTTSVCRRDSA